MRTATSTLLGRADELSIVEKLVTDARQGRGGALVLRGEAGIGKTTLLRHAADTAGASTEEPGGSTVLWSAGLEPESGLPFAGLNLLLRGTQQHTDMLDPEHAHVLRHAIGEIPQREGPGHRHAVGLALLALFDALAALHPVLVVVDDAHWLDQPSAEALLFAARRVHPRRVAVLLAARDAHAPAFPAPGLDELRLRHLDDTTVRALLTARAGDLPRHIADEVTAQSGGNPLAALELAAARRAGRTPGSATGVALPIHSTLTLGFADRIAELPPHTRTLLLVAAADGTCDTSTILTAAKALGVSHEDLRPAEEAGLIGFTETCLWFHHPLIRSAAYHRTFLLDRIAAHAALADVLDSPENADRRAWHLASARTGPDEDVARALEESAEHARLRGGLSSVSATYERAAALSPRPADRGRRLAAGAHAAAEAGCPAHASALARRAVDQLTDPVERARALSTYAAVADDQGNPGDARRVLVEQAPGVATQAPELAEWLLLWAADTAREAGAAAEAAEIATVAERIDLPGARRVRMVADATGGAPHTRVRTLRRLLRAVESAPVAEPHRPLTLRRRVTVARWRLAAGEDDLALREAREIVDDCRASAADGVLPSALSVLSTAQYVLGDHGDALATATEGARLADEIGQPRWVDELRSTLTQLAAVRGEEDPVTHTTTRTRAVGPDPRDVLELGLGRHDAVFERLSAGAETTLDAVSSVPDLVEAAAHAARPDGGGVERSEWRRRDETTLRALRHYVTWACATGNHWARAVALRCLAQLDDRTETGAGNDTVTDILAEFGARLGADGSEPANAPEARTERLFSRALEAHRAGPGRLFERARTELAFGEWLRRRRRRTQARTHLRTAVSLFEDLCALPWAERGRAELRASGERGASPASAARPLADASGRLTPQESRIVSLAADGLSNREIGSRLFLSPRTVGYHLYKAYPKLGVTSRGELAALGLAKPAPAV